MEPELGSCFLCVVPRVVDIDFHAVVTQFARCVDYLSIAQVGQFCLNVRLGHCTLEPLTLIWFLIIALIV